MIFLRNSLMGALLGLAGLASLAATPARADLMVTCTTTENPSYCTGNPSQFGGVHSGNDIHTFVGTAGPYSVTELVEGVDYLGGNPYVMDVHNFEVNVTGAGQLSLFVTQDQISGNGLTQFLMSFGTAQITGDLTGVVRTLYLDYGTANQVLLGSCSGPNGTSCIRTSAAVNLTGSYSLTEEFDMVAGASCTPGSSCTLSTDDLFSVPEPAALSIFGLGLLVLGGMGWRRRSRGKLAG